MSTDPGSTPSPARSAATVDGVFATATLIRSADDLAREGAFENDAELDEFLSDLHAMRHSDLA